MRKENRLASEADFQRVRRQGHPYPHPFFVLRVCENGGPHIRFGITASKKLGGAVVRNRLRRRISEQLRARIGALDPRWDVVLSVRQPALDASYADLGVALDASLYRAGLMMTLPEAPS